MEEWIWTMVNYLKTRRKGSFWTPLLKLTSTASSARNGFQTKMALKHTMLALTPTPTSISATLAGTMPQPTPILLSTGPSTTLVTDMAVLVVLTLEFADSWTFYFSILSLYMHMEVAEILAKEGISAEVINLHSIRPLDRPAINASARKTNRLVSVEEGFPQHGVGAEICASVVEESFEYLDAPVERITGADVPMPYAANLERLAVPQVVVFLEGPPAGMDILLNSLGIKHAAKPPPPSPPVIEDAGFGVNMITNGWFPLGKCTMSVQTGSPHIMPPMARDSLGIHEPLSGRYILVTNRTQNWMRPAQMTTDKVKLYLTCQVSAWVGVDSQWVNGGQVEIIDDRWHEIGGCFRVEKQAAKIVVAAGVDIRFCCCWCRHRNCVYFYLSKA